jgi:RNA polymerase sigma factor (sigma-70 family)
MMGTLTSAQLATIVADASAGDHVAFARIVDAHHLDMRRVCYVVCGDFDIAEEAVQRAWHIAWRRLSTIRDPDRLRPWLLAVAANEARKLIGARRRRQVREVAILADRTGGDPDPADRVELIDLANALGRLDPKDRALVALRYIAGLDSTELGAVFGLSPSGTRARLARLLDRLQKELGDG